MLAAALAAATVPLGASLTPPQTPTFSAKVEAVRVDVLVTENGRPVRGLTHEDFEIRDNGVPQDVTLVSSEQLPLTVVLALDASDSVTGERLKHLQAAASALIHGLDRKDQVALLTFNQTLHLGSPPTSDVEPVQRAIDRIAPGGSTALFDATYAAMVMAESDVGRSLLIVFTDGADTASYLRREAVVDAARRTEVVAYGAAVASRRRPKFLKDFVDQTGGSLLEIESTGDLPNAFLRILEEFRQRYLLSYSPRNVTKTGWHRIDVRVKNRRVSVKARAGYQSGA
jgi:VWFA-related protein